jgi:hypothetical protein
MVSLTSHQLELVTNALRPLRSEKERAEFLKCLDEQLKVRDVDVISACERAARAINDAGS